MSVALLPDLRAEEAAPVPSNGPLAAAMSVSVKALCAFAAKAGDLDLRFVPAPSAQEGLAGHRFVQGRRGAGYESEVSLSSSHGALRVRGRADGFDAERGRVEEIKTFRGDFDAIKSNHRALHWAQARTYGWMLCERHGLERIEVALVYLDLVSSEETVLAESVTRQSLGEGFRELCERYSAWAAQEAAHRDRLEAALATLSFPHDDFRAGQRELAEAVFRSATSARCLLAQAPTGIGKTVATIFPLLKAVPAQRIDKIFFLTAKTPGRALALEGLRRIAAGRAPLRVLELAARDKVCEHPGKACHGESCPLAKGFYDRLPAARARAIDAGWLDRASLREVAREQDVCPYFLAQEMVRWADVVVADYNYYFDGSAFLYAWAREEEWRVSLLVDEAHNLLDRARGMYSAQLGLRGLAEALPLVPAAAKPALRQLDREWQRLQRDQQEPYQVHEQLPERWLRALQESVSVLAEHFAGLAAPPAEALQRFFFDALRFARLAESFGRHSVLEALLRPGGDAAGSSGSSAAAGFELSIRNLVPAPFLRPRFESCHSAACFSGTLAPFDYYQDMLGLPQGTVTLEVASPFRSEQLRVRVATDLSTRWRDRRRSLHPLVDLIAAQYRRRPGNYLAFFSSFDYLEAAADAFGQRHPDVTCWRQARGMGESERTAFVARFAEGGCGIGFAVLGGAFGEGIDLPGDRLVGAFVASLGMPQFNPANEVARERMEALFGEGHAYTYLYPGLQKVVQAAGRVIRTEQDVGVLYLLDDRFARPEIRRLLPTWWQVVAAPSSSLESPPRSA
ncbi:DNA excision repair protein ERCC-2 [Burkholderiales bacterium 8X]|nr:DNA excision repair protein ERCC-2 [Burkholderiales bacterium 8X]